MGGIYRFCRSNPASESGQYPVKTVPAKAPGSDSFCSGCQPFPGARDRLAFVKGAVLTILARAYCDRDRVGVIVFGDRKAQTVLPYTKSVDLAAKRMEEMKAKGNTPLGMGIREALRLQKQDQKKHPEDLHLTVVLTDGKCNYDVLPGKPLLLAMAAAEQLGKEAAGALVVDTEKGVFSMGLAKKLAEATGGEYVEIG